MRNNSSQPQVRIDKALDWPSRIAGTTGVLGAMLAFALLGNPAQAVIAPPSNSVTLAWNNSPSPGVTGYRVYYGAASGNYTSSVEAGNATTNTIHGLVSGGAYFFAVKAYDSNGLESTFSNEISFVPGSPTVQINVTANGQVVLTVKGQVGHTYDIQASPNLGSGTVVIGTVTVGANGSAQFTDTNATALANGFYNVVEVLRANVQIRVGPAREVVLTVAGPVGHAYDIEASPDFKTWAVIGNVTMGAGGSVDFTDTNAASFPKRFYRIHDTQP